MTLTPAREARRTLAIEAVLAAHETGDPEAFRAAVDQMYVTDRVVKAEQLAEHGHLPGSIDGCLTVLQLATRIVHVLAPAVDLEESRAA